MCELRKPVNRGKWIRLTKGSRDPEAPQCSWHDSWWLFSSWTQPPGSPAAVSAPGLCETNFPLCLSQLEQTVSKWSLMKTNVKQLLFLISFLCVCVCVYVYLYVSMDMVGMKKRLLEGGHYNCLQIFKRLMLGWGIRWFGIGRKNTPQ